MYCNFIRQSDHLPKSGCRELYELCRLYFKEKFTIGRDRFYDILRANDLMLRRKRYRPRTTTASQNYRLYPDLLNTVPKYVPPGNGKMVVSDITYVYTTNGFAYLSLVTDAHSRYIVGARLHYSLETTGPLEALKQAIATYHRFDIDTTGMIHHSDRGVQYASKEYTDTLRSNGIRISMTQTGDPLHNALAERMNNTLKNGWLFNDGNLTFEQAKDAISKAIRMYNEARPHKALDMRTPQEIFCGTAKNPLTH